MRALHDVVKAGYVRYIGMSSCYAYQCEQHLHQDDLRNNMASSSPRNAELRHHAQANAFHLHAEPLQPNLSRGGARDVSNP